MASPRKKPLQLKIVRDQVEEDAEVSELVTRLETEADRELAGTVTFRWAGGRSPSSNAPPR